MAEAVQTNFDGKFGKTSLSLMTKMAASKMPGGFGLNSCREHLETRWRLQRGHQNRVLLRAVLVAPSARIADDENAKIFLDSVVKDLINESTIQMPLINEAPASHTGSIDPKFYESLHQRQKDLSLKLLEVYAESIGVDIGSSQRESAKIQDVVADLQTELDHWVAEHGEIYAAGTKPAMSPKKARVYDSSWNWAVTDLIRTYHELVSGCFTGGHQELAQISESIANRSELTLCDVIIRLQGHSDAAQHPAHDWLRDLLSRCRASWTKQPVFRGDATSTAPRTTIDENGSVHVSEVVREDSNCFTSWISKVLTVPTCKSDDQEPIICIKSKTKGGWRFNKKITTTYFEALNTAATAGVSFSGKSALLVGAGPGSIGSQVLAGLLQGGARVVVTTSSFSLATTKFFQNIYARNGARMAMLVLVPFNQGSIRDVENLLAWIHSAEDGLGWDLDFVLPFAAIGEEGRDIDSIDSKSELAHRVMLTNTIRLLGGVKRHKEAASPYCRSAHVILPLSPNHGLFGNDGLYSESKMGLESLLSKWLSEAWGQHLSICGAAIGWTRSTGLMAANDIVAEGIENLGLRTFSQQEMAFNILSLMASRMVELSQDEPIFADLTGRFDVADDLSDAVSQIRLQIQSESQILKEVKAEDDLEASLTQKEHSPEARDQQPRRLADLHLDFPELGDYETETQGVKDNLQGIMDLDRVVVCTGFAEIGPYGNARTRWQMESRGDFTTEGWVEMAWIMGLITHHNGPLRGNTDVYCGWVDVESKQPIDDMNVGTRYGKQILEHTGIRILEPSPSNGFDPYKKQVLQEVVLEGDLAAFGASQEQALQLEREHGSLAEVTKLGDDQYLVKLKRGATLLVPRALDTENHVAGQIPSGWDPRTYGITEDIISQVDRVTLYTLVCTVEALLSSGVIDPYELYNYVHLSEVGNCIGSGQGGLLSLVKMLKDRYKDKDIQSDILQETFINTVNAWVNMLLLSATGPIRTPVGACATSLESLDTAHDLIVTGKARVCLVGGVDDLSEDFAHEFANMKATVNAKDEYEKGRTPKEMSRPTASSRKGFVESHGCGVQVVMSAKLAVEMGVPIYAIVAFTGTSSDKIGRSVPAPGQGVISNVRECRPEGHSSASCTPLLDVKFRRRTLQRRQKQVEALRLSELEELEGEAQVVASEAIKNRATFDKDEFLQIRTHAINEEANMRVLDNLNSIGNQFWRGNPSISPIRGALAMWGLSVDDIGVASFHGTSTVMNEKNEFEIIQRQMEHLGRAKGNPILGVFQKHLTGHPKGAAGAWMFNGCLQMLQSGLVPGNGNADNIDAALRSFDYIAVPDRAIQTSGIAACSVTAFGFGQKGTQAIGVHPRYLYATLAPEQFDAYRAKVEKRRRAADQFFENGMIGNNLVQFKTEEPFGDSKDSIRAMLDPTARLKA